MWTNRIPDDGLMSRTMRWDMTNVWYVHASCYGDGVTQRNGIGVHYEEISMSNVSLAIHGGTITTRDVEEMSVSTQS
jgi:hypothetical protein